MILINLGFKINIMKHKMNLLLFGFLLVSSFSSCGGDDKKKDEPSNPSKEVSVTVSPESLNPDFNSQILELTVNATADWAIRTDASWISFRPAGGVKNETTVVKVSIEANKDFDSRTAVINIISGTNTIKTINVTQGFAMSASSSVSSLILSGEAASNSFSVTSNGNWTLTSDAEWLSVNPSNGGKGETVVTVSAPSNETEESRVANISLVCGDSSSTIKVTQLNYNVSAPEGYTLVWNDEFNNDGTPGPDWVIENQAAGWVNNELQTYTSRQVDGKYTLEIKDGFLHINCFKGADGKIYSGRMNAKPNTGWQYGYVEARINLPKGKGTWPAFWMMPSNVDWNSDPWPYCGEIDIIEEVGVVPNEVSSSIHTWKYNHTIGTQKTHAMTIAGAEGEFHTYALEWDENKITTYVDGKIQLSVTKAALGSDHASWPFDRAFYPILNLAWGGDWGGMKGVDESALPVTMLVDYVRIFQKQ